MNSKNGERERERGQITPHQNSIKKLIKVNSINSNETKVAM